MRIIVPALTPYIDRLIIKPLAWGIQYTARLNSIYGILDVKGVLFESVTQQVMALKSI